MASGVVTLHRWDDIPAEQINPTISRQFITAERVTVARFEIKRGGEVLQIAPHVPHAAEAIEDTVAIDVFSPTRQDWVNKTDNYFQR